MAARTLELRHWVPLIGQYEQQSGCEVEIKKKKEQWEDDYEVLNAWSGGWRNFGQGYRNFVGPTTRCGED